MFPREPHVQEIIIRHQIFYFPILGISGSANSGTRNCLSERKTLHQVGLSQTS
jgi:hypothetical protein